MNMCLIAIKMQQILYRNDYLLKFIKLLADRIIFKLNEEYILVIKAAVEIFLHFYGIVNRLV